MNTYASGEEPAVGDVVTMRRHKPKRPATVLEVSEDGDVITVRWGNSRNKQHYTPNEFVLVQPAETDDERHRREVVGVRHDEQF